MLHYIDENKNRMHNAIELLNDLGFNLIFIDGAFYTFTSFEPADETNSYITMIGKNVTKFIETSISVTGITKQRETEIHQNLATLPNRMREYSPDTKWIKYVAQ